MSAPQKPQTTEEGQKQETASRSVSQAKKAQSQTKQRKQETPKVEDSDLHDLVESVDSLKLQAALPEGVRVILYDLETTGLGKSQNIGIVEIGAIALGYTESQGWKVLQEFHSFVQPKVSIQKSVPHKLKGNSIPFKNVLPGFMSFLQSHLDSSDQCILAAHNGRRYDHRIMFFHGFQPPLALEMADSLDWFKKHYPGENTYSLGALYKQHMGASIPAAHNALPDVYAIYKLMNNKKKRIHPDSLITEPWSAIKARCS